jgi:ubiquinone/menaquinone biosynthesis C-methylase UbiE
MPTTPPQHRHVHSGMSTRDLIDANLLLQQAGVKAGDHLLDLGCGDGYIAIEAAKSFVGPLGLVHALDIDGRAIDGIVAKARESGLWNVEAAVADATKPLPVPAASIDACIIANVLHGFVVNGEVNIVLENLVVVMKPSGTITIVEFKKEEEIPGPPFEDRLASDDVESILARIGGRVSSRFDPGPLHFGIVFELSGEFS